MNDVAPIQFMVYIPPKQYSPLHVKHRDAKGAEHRNEYDAFLVPRFGGCTIYNPVEVVVDGNESENQSKKRKIKYDIVVMVQGDEPMINSKMISDAIQPLLKNKKINITNLICPINNRKDFEDPNFIKVVHDKSYNALYFSRSIIPFTKFKKGGYIKKQVCVIPFRRNFLIKYNKMKPSKLEKIESIDMLRILENGHKVFLVNTKRFAHAVDTKKDLHKVEKYMRN